MLAEQADSVAVVGRRPHPSVAQMCWATSTIHHSYPFPAVTAAANSRWARSVIGQNRRRPVKSIGIQVGPENTPEPPFGAALLIN